MNWLAIICAAAAYWVLGAIWYMALFGKTWAAAMQRHGVTLQQSGMAAKMIGNFIANLVAAIIMARLFERTPGIDLYHGFRLGLGLGVGFSATAITISYLWESKPFKIWLIDVIYYILGAVVMGLVLAAWP
jgi:hypothetical protein